LGKRKIHQADKMICPVCGAPDGRVLARRTGYSLHGCARCGVTFKRIVRLNNETVQRLQDGVYTESYLGNRLGQRRVIRMMNADRLRMLQKYVRAGNLLEVGCGSGDFLALAQKNGFTALGVDTSQLLARLARERGMDVRCGRLEEIDLPERHFDVACLFHVLEHMEEPGQFLSTVRGLLKARGLLFIVTPNRRSFTGRLFGLRHPVYTQEDHLLFFSTPTLGGLLRAQGFEVVRTASREYAHHVWSSAVGFFRTLLLSFRRGSRGTRIASAAEAGVGCVPAAERLVGCSPAAETGVRATSAPGKPGGGLRRLVWRLPLFLGALLSPLTFIYRILVQQTTRGHELIVMAGKADNE
jgi:SAM-dependent methyltransferase